MKHICMSVFIATVASAVTGATAVSLLVSVSFVAGVAWTKLAQYTDTLAEQEQGE